MIKRLTKHGNSLALVIERAILELLKIDTDTPLEITTDGTVLVISPVKSKKKRLEFERALKKVNRKYSRALKNLGE